MAKPRLKQVWPSSPLRPLFDELNRAVTEQADVHPGTGFGMIGRAITRTSQDYMWAVADGDVSGAAIDDDGTGNRTIGLGSAFEMTIDYDGNDVRLVRAGPDDPTRFTIFNPAQDSIDDGTLMMVQKCFGLWFVVWSECVASGSQQ